MEPADQRRSVVARLDAKFSHGASGLDRTQRVGELAVGAEVAYVLRRESSVAARRPGCDGDHAQSLQVAHVLGGAARRGRSGSGGQKWQRLVRSQRRNPPLALQLHA
jgi:hypothetical protein